MIKLDPRPPRGGRLNTTKIASRFQSAPPCGGDGKNIPLLLLGSNTSEKQFLFKSQKLLAYPENRSYKKPVIRANRMTGPIDGLKNKARPSVRGWKSIVFSKSRQWPICEKWTIDMTRQHNTTRTGASFSDATIEAVWLKATPIPGRPGYAKDQCGATIYRHSYGAITDLGWEVDHRDPVSNGGQDDLDNLQPLQWQNNRCKGDQYPSWSCTVRS